MRAGGSFVFTQRSGLAEQFEKLNSRPFLGYFSRLFKAIST